MARYTYTEFDGLTLPTDNPQHDIGTDESITPDLVMLPGGGTFDPLGSARARGRPRIIIVKFDIRESSYSAVGTTFATWRAKRGVRGTLTRTLPDGSTQTRTARCIRVDAQGVGGQALTLPVSVFFQALGDSWHGAFNSDTITLDATPKSAEINNGGNEICRDITITVTAKGSDITQLDIENEETGHISKIRYSGTIATDKGLVLTCGDMTCENDGVDDSDNISFLSGHTIPGWLRLKPGDNTIKVIRTGGDNTSTAVFAFYDEYA